MQGAAVAGAADAAWSLSLSDDMQGACAGCVGANQGAHVGGGLPPGRGAGLAMVMQRGSGTDNGSESSSGMVGIGTLVQPSCFALRARVACSWRHAIRCDASRESSCSIFGAARN